MAFPKLPPDTMNKRTKLNRTKLLSVSLGLVLASSLLVVSCGREQTVFLQVAEMFQVLDLQVGTQRILPSSGPVAHELGEGWVGRSSSRTDPRIAVRVRSKRAELFIVAAVPGALEMTLEARALSQPEDGPQTMTLVLSGEPLTTFELGEEYEAYSVRLPEELLRAGKNRVTLEFAALGPVESGDATVMGAARVRNLVVQNSLGRPAWTPRSGEVPDSPDAEPSAESVPVAVDPLVGPDLVMPTDSILDLAIEVPEGGRVVADLVRTLADEAAGEDLSASLELVDTEGEKEILYEHAFGEKSWFGSPDQASLDLSLAGRVGEVVLLRFRVWGAANGNVAWQGLRITCECETPPPAYMSCDLPQVPSSGRLGRPDIFVILLDAARADAFSTYGAARPTPFVDSLAADGTKFTSAYAPSSWTAPTTASLLSGRYPDAHGVQDWEFYLPDSITTLTETLADAGYYTFLGSHHNVYRGNGPLRRGFEGIELIYHRERDRLPNVESLFAPGRPTFAFIHLLPPHTPYEPPPPFRGAYADESGPVIDVSDASLNSYYRSGNEPAEEAVRYARDRYDENVAYADSLVGRILAALRERGRYDDALVILLADHGEAFFEHHDFLHRQTLYEEVLRIPLVMKWPAGTEGFVPVVDAPVSLVDLGPTLVDGLGIDDPRTSFQGISLLPTVFDGVVADRSIYAATRPTSRSVKPMLALYRGRKKIILDETGAAHLYDLSLDPAEQIDEAKFEPVGTQLLMQELLAQQRCNQVLLAGAGQAPRIELDAERLRELRALGYIQ